jgi:hypothetical protein
MNEKIVDLLMKHLVVKVYFFHMQDFFNLIFMKY